MFTLSTAKAVGVKLGLSGTATLGTDYGNDHVSQTVSTGNTSISWTIIGRPLIEVRDILGHTTIKMAERYAHLAPENLVDAVSSIEDRLHFGSTATSDEQSREDVSPQVIDKMDERWWARKDSNLRPMDYESTALTN